MKPTSLQTAGDPNVQDPCRLVHGVVWWTEQLEIEECKELDGNNNTAMWAVKLIVSRITLHQRTDGGKRT